MDAPRQEDVSVLALAGDVIRRPELLLAVCEDDRTFQAIAPKLLLIAGVGLALFGCVVGSYRGGIQVLYAALKMPLLIGIPLVVGLPAVRTFWAGAGASTTWRKVGLSGLVGAARIGVLASALGPLLALAYSVQLPYHLAVLLLAASLIAAGLPGLTVVSTAIGEATAHRTLARVCSLALMGLLAAQTGWILRPFVARPTAEVAFLRPMEEDIFSALLASGASSIGLYPGWEARSSGLLGREKAP
jgi:hypothetical protein